MQTLIVTCLLGDCSNAVFHDAKSGAHKLPCTKLKN